MAETDRNRDSRMDRIERILELSMADHERIREHHEHFRADYKQLLIVQLTKQGEIQDLLKVTQEHSR